MEELMKLKSKQEWLVFLELHRKSGLNITEFCKTQKITSSMFYYYAKLHKTTTSSTQIPKIDLPKQSTFISLTTKKEFKIKLNDAISLTFDSLPEATWMANFVKSFGGHHATN